MMCFHSPPWCFSIIIYGQHYQTGGIFRQLDNLHRLFFVVHFWHPHIVGINFLAIDFDQTIIGIHTGGAWKGSVQELTTYVRPIFKNLIKEAHAASLKVAIVTFSPQIGFIREVRERLLSKKIVGAVAHRLGISLSVTLICS